MLRISKLADYASVIMVCIAQQAPAARRSAKELALKTHLSVPTVSKLLKLLAQAGLLISSRGTTGGYTLARLPIDISVMDILSAIDGKPSLTQCSDEHDTHTCTLADVCGLSTNWKLISRAVMTALDGITLDQLSQSIATDTHINVSAITHLHPQSATKTTKTTKAVNAHD